MGAKKADPWLGFTVRSTDIGVPIPSCVVSYGGFYEEHLPRPSWYGLLHPVISTARKGNEPEQEPTSGPAHVPYSATLTDQHETIERGEGVTAGSGEDNLQL